MLHATIQELSGTIITQSSSLFTARTLSYDIVNTTLRSLNETFGAEVFTVEQFDIISLLTFDTLNDMKENLLLFTEKISKYISQDIKKPLHLLAIEYLKENYSSPYFSIASMAQSLSVSSAHLSRVFKDEMGITLSKYITEYKITIAKEKLLHEDTPITTIVKEVGYYDTSSFIRLFKQTVGVTPGEFRKKAQFLSEEDQNQQGQ